MGVDVENVFDRICPELESAEFGKWSKADLTTLLSLISGFHDVKRRMLQHCECVHQHECACNNSSGEENPCEADRVDNGHNNELIAVSAVDLLEVGRSLTKLRRYLQKRIPYGTISEPVAQPCPQGGRGSCNDSKTEGTSRIIEPVQPPAYAVDAFLYLEEDVDSLVNRGCISREYCRTCGSVNIGLCEFVTHSFSQEQLTYLTCALLPSLGDSTSYCLTSDYALVPRPKASRCLTIPISCHHVVDVGSRLGVVPLACYFASQRKRSLGTQLVTGIELDKDFVALQEELFKKFAAEPTAMRLRLIHSNCFEAEGLEALRSADVLILHNVFEYFTENVEEHLRSWKQLRSAAARRGQLLICCPSLQETLAAFPGDCVRTVFANEQPVSESVTAGDENIEKHQTSRKRCRVASEEYAGCLEEWWRSWVQEIDVSYLQESFLSMWGSCDENDICGASSAGDDGEALETLQNMRVYMVK